MPNYLTEKLGPFPVWVWVLAGGGVVAVILYRMRSGQQAQPDGFAAGFDAGASFEPPSAPAPGQPSQPQMPDITINFPDWPSIPGTGDPSGTPADPQPDPVPTPAQPTPKPAPVPQPSPAPVNLWQTVSGFFGEVILRTVQGIDMRVRRISTMSEQGTFKIDLAGITDWAVVGEGTVDSQGNVRRPDGSLLGKLNAIQWAAFLRGGAPSPTAPVTSPELGFGQVGHGQAVIDFYGAPVRATRIGDVRDDGSFDILLGSTADWTNFGRARVDPLGNIIVGGKSIPYKLNPINIAALLQGAWPPPSGVGTAGTAQTVAAA